MNSAVNWINVTFLYIKFMQFFSLVFVLSFDAKFNGKLSADVLKHERVVLFNCVYVRCINRESDREIHFDLDSSE